MQRLWRLLDFARTGIDAVFSGPCAFLSPIVGEFTNMQARTSFSSPRPARLNVLAQKKQFPVPNQCEIQVGAEHWQSNPENVLVFHQLTGIPVIVVPQGHHDLGKAYVGPLLDRWLRS